MKSYLFVSAHCSALIESLKPSIIRSVSQAGALLHAPVACSRIKHAQAGSDPEQTAILRKLHMSGPEMMQFLGKSK